MKVRWVVRLATVLMLALVVAMVVFSLWQSTVDGHRVERLQRERAIADAYSEASAEALQAEVDFGRWSRALAPEDLASILRHDTVYMGALRTAADLEKASGTNDLFAAHLLAYSQQFHEIFDRLGKAGDGAPAMLPDMGPEFAKAYGVLLLAVSHGELGDPTPVLETLNPSGGAAPATVVVNPMPVLISAQAVAAKARVISLADGIARAVERDRLISAFSYSAAGILLAVLVGATLVFGRREASARAENEHLRRAVSTDPLTILGNRRAFEEALKALSQEPRRGAPTALLMMDLDEFKELNDTFGHDRGDATLRAFAAVVREHCSPRGHGYRIGGDEFAAILPDCDEGAARVIAESIRTRAARELTNNVTVSSGIAQLPAGDCDESLLRQRADAALYEAKLRGRDLVVVYDPERDAAPVFPASKLAAVRQLLSEGKIEAVFQPIWSLHDHELIGFEALSRPAPEYGLSGPEQAFDIAERFGRSADLDRLCRARILEAAATLPPNTTLFINISPYTVTHHSFTPFALFQELRDASIDPRRVVLEITERSQLPPAAIAEGVARLHEYGLRVALDDVGAGNNGLEMLRRVPVEYVKVDRGVLTSATRSITGRAALMAILAFAAESRARVVAEGIEDAATFAVVREIAQCTLRGDPLLIHGVQGYLFGRPEPATAAALSSVPSALVA